MKQAVILCGGLGTRLGQLARSTPKPLLPVDGRPFLEILIQETARSGVRDFLLLAGHMADQIEQFANGLPQRLGLDLSIKVCVEQGRAGTGGALFQAREHLDDVFFLLNGDSFFSCHLHELTAEMRANAKLDGVIALRRVEDSCRFGSVEMSEGLIHSFCEKRADAGAGLINAGVYILRRSLVDALSDACSLEQDVLPGLAEQRRLGGVTGHGYFIDIGLPETYAESQRQLIAARRGRAVFLDRDGVINVDRGHVGQVERFAFMPGAVEAIKLLNAARYYVFVVTNQAGIAKGKYSIADYWHLRDHIRALLHAVGAQIDDERFCAYHPDAVHDEWRAESDWRKPGAGMLEDLARSWPIERKGSFLIGDQPWDMAAAEAFGIPGFRFAGGRLDTFVTSCLVHMAENGRSP